MRYIRVINDLGDEYLTTYEEHCEMVAELQDNGFEFEGVIIKQANTIEELCDCFVKIKRKGNCKPYILKFDYKDLPTLKEQAIKYKDSPVYGAIHIEDKGLIYVAKINDKGKLCLL